MEDLARARALLLAWHDKTHRRLPWRETTDPYAILVSEVMLQQTQVSRVVPAYQRFLTSFPTVAALAAADAGTVIRAWQGLGYNRRALALHGAARAVMANHDGVMPADVAALRALPGIGEYTARAVAAFAYNADAAPVDVNVGRVLQRALTGRALSRAALQRVADEVLPRGRSRAWSSALMDLGATICTARSGQCDECPIAEVCAWRRTGGPDPAEVSVVRSRPQARFTDSDRFHRGRLVDAMRSAPVPLASVAEAAHLDRGERLDRIVGALLADGLAVEEAGVLRLPQ